MLELSRWGSQRIAEPRPEDTFRPAWGPLDDLGPQIIWSGGAEISLNAGGEITGPHVKVLRGDIAIWNPHTRRWAHGPRAPRQLIYDAPAVWSGRQLFALAQDGHLLAYGR